MPSTGAPEEQAFHSGTKARKVAEGWGAPFASSGYTSRVPTAKDLQDRRSNPKMGALNRQVGVLNQITGYRRHKNPFVRF